MLGMINETRNTKYDITNYLELNTWITYNTFFAMKNFPMSVHKYPVLKERVGKIQSSEDQANKQV